MFGPCCKLQFRFVVFLPLKKTSENSEVFLSGKNQTKDWKLNAFFPDATRRGDVEAGRQQSDSSSTGFYTF